MHSVIKLRTVDVSAGERNKTPSGVGLPSRRREDAQKRVILVLTKDVLTISRLVLLLSALIFVWGNIDID